MAELGTHPDVAQRLLAQLEWVEPYLRNGASRVRSDEPEPGAMDWWANGTLRVLPDDEADAIEPWHETKGATHSVKQRGEEAVEVTIFEASG